MLTYSSHKNLPFDLFNRDVVRYYTCSWTKTNNIGKVYGMNKGKTQHALYVGGV